MRLAQAEYELEMRSKPNVNQLNTMTNALRKAFNDDNMEVEQAGKGFTFVSEVMNPTPIIYWKVDNEGVLHIRATDSTGYSQGLGGWIQSASSIVKAKIEEPIAPAGSCYRMFYRCANLESIENIENLHTENVTRMDGMFDGCTNLKNLNVSGFDTSNVTEMGEMFSGCRALTKINANNFDTSNVIDMPSMFNGCVNLTELNVDNFDTSLLKNASAMFNGCNSLTKISLNNWSTASMTSVSAMLQISVNHAMTEVNLGKNFTLNNDINCDRIFNNHKNTITINCNATTAAKLSEMYRGFTNIHAIY